MYLLQLVNDLLDQIKGYKFITKLDLQNSYNNIRIKDGDQWKIAFKIARGLYESIVIYFELYNSSATFQAFIDDVFHEQKQKEGLLIYIDDLLIMSQIIIKLQEWIKEILQVCQNYRLSIKIEKCVFHRQKVKYLGLIIKLNCIAIDFIKPKEILK